jgi:hypothetical protein
MADSPTTENGPLHTPDATLDDRLMRATFATPSDAQSARERLIEGGMAADRVNIIENAAESPGVRDTLQPKDQGVWARVRETILPDDSNTATADAARHGEAILELRPTKEEVEFAVRIIKDCNPTHFDASLERWRNSG